jgi:hypothetical protein
MQRLSKKIGISDVAIAKHCRKIDIPVPERGYWNKRQTGQTDERVALPQADLTTITTVSMSGTLPNQLRAYIQGEPGDETEPDESIIRDAARGGSIS